MKQKLSSILIIALMITLVIPFSSVSAYTDGYANGKATTIMTPDIYFITKSHDSKVLTNLITDNDETTVTLLPKNRMLLIDLGTNRTIDSYKINSDLKNMRISFYDRDTGYLDAFELNGGTGTLEVFPKDKVISKVRYITLYTMSGEDININELDFFYSKDPNITKPEPTDPTTPVDPNPQPEPQPTGDRAILTVTMTTGLEKEFDLSMSEVNDFINWYDVKENGSGPARYGIDKHNNNKGPFSKRVDYVIFKNILSFEVDEYTLSK